MSIEMLSIRVNDDVKKWFLKWKKNERKKNHFADMYIIENVLKLGVKAWDEGGRIE